MLTSRERCIRSILFEDPDRIPLILSIRPEPYEKLRKTLGASSYIDICKRLGVDVVSVGIGIRGGYLPEGVEVKEGPYAPAYTVGEYKGFEVRRDVWGIESIWAPNSTYTYTYYRHPLQHIPLEKYRWPRVNVEAFDDVVKSRKNYEDYCLAGVVEHMWEIAWQLTGFNEIMRFNVY